MKRLQDEVIIVTGGSRGIGRAIVLALAKEGASVAFTFVRGIEKANQLVDEIHDLGSRAFALQMDVRQYEACQNLVDRVKAEFGRLDMLVNNAGINRDNPLMLMSPEQWHEVIDTNLTGVFNMTRSVIVTMMKQKKGNIVNISSLSGIHPLPRQVNYSSSKAGIIGFTKSLACEISSYKIRVNAVAPGYIDTEMIADLKHKDKLIEKIPLNRFGTPEEVAEVVVFLLSKESNYITGQVVQIDGGLGI